MARRQFTFDRTAAIKAAWDFLWASNLKARADANSFRNETYYLTASDLEYQVRQFAEETAAGKPWGSSGRTYGRGFGTVRFPGNLNGDVRDWLRREESAGRLAGHNFGRGHISGKRYRPASEPISDTEKNTMAKKAAQRDKPRPIHFGRNGRCACVKRSPFSRPNYRIYVTGDKTKVTCPRCIKIITAAKEAA